MSLVSLLTGDDRSFDFEHAMAHRGLLGGLAPLDRFSATTYTMDPIEDTDKRASLWHLNHQHLHDDFADVVLAHTAATGGPGVSINQILVDSDLSDQRSRAWWIFANHREHYNAADLNPPMPVNYPFW